MQLNTATLTAPPALDLLSLLPSLNATSAASTNSSAPIVQNFSAMLTEMIGPAAVPATSQTTSTTFQIGGVAVSGPAAPGMAAPPAVAVPEVQPVAELPQMQPLLPEAPAVSPKAPGPEKKPAASAVDPTLTAPVASPFEMAGMLQPAVATLTETALQGSRSSFAKVDEPATAPTAAELAAVPQPELERAFADLKSFELTTHNEASKSADLHPLQAQPAAAAPADQAKQALVTTDPIANIQQQQLPLRIIPVPRVMSDAKPDRGKSDSLMSSSDTTISSPTGQFADLIRPVVQPDQVIPAHYVEVPNMPHVQVVRTVSMEVGDPGSEVTIRLEARDGDLTLQLNSGNEPLRQDLESGVGSLVNALKDEQIQVSNVEVSKSPTNKVRRMKEAR